MKKKILPVLTDLLIIGTLAACTIEAEIATPVFRGYFQNVDYSDPNVFLQTGRQTEITERIRAIAQRFNTRKDLSTLMEIFRWMRANLRGGTGEKFARTSHDIIASGIVTGCTDNGLVFAALARAKGIPSVFVQTARIDWIKSLVNSDPTAGYIVGHILVEVYLSGQWYLVDSTSGKLFLNYNRNDLSLPDGYYVFAKSIEVWDSGARDEKENHSAMTRIFRGFDPSTYKNPKYDYIDLMTGERRKSEDFTPDSSRAPTAYGSVILGRRTPVELFASRFTAYLGLRRQCAFQLVKEDEVRSVPILVLLLSRDLESQVPGFLLELVPEVRSNDARITMSVRRQGKRIILIKAHSEQDLVNSINALPSDFPNRDYSYAPQAKQTKQMPGQIDEELMDLISKLTPEELDELKRYAEWLISRRK